jgi:hypothetical protein
VAEHDRAVRAHKALEACALQQIRQMVGVVSRVKIAAAYAANERAHEHLARSRLWGREVLDLEATLVENRGAHHGTP